MSLKDTDDNYALRSRSALPSGPKLIPKNDLVSSFSPRGSPQNLISADNVKAGAMQAVDLPPSPDLRTLPARDIPTVSRGQNYFDEYFQGWENHTEISLLGAHTRTSLTSSLLNTSPLSGGAIELSDSIGVIPLAPNCQHDHHPSGAQACPGGLPKGQPRSHWWWWEIASVIISMACMVTAVIVLANINNTRLSDWSLYLQPNTILSILATVAKSTMLFSVSICLSQLKWTHFQSRSAGRPLTHLEDFDEASRGPLGSLFLLGNRHLAAFAPCMLALITVASLAIDPMAQEVLKFPKKESHLHNVTTGIGQASSYVLKSDDQDSIDVRALCIDPSN